jgi:metal-responsive CopG/Arc/MetJ family transcriptional regulator
MNRTFSSPPQPLTFKADEEFIEMLDEWRAVRKPIPTRSEAIRELCKAGMTKRQKRKDA